MPVVPLSSLASLVLSHLCRRDTASGRCPTKPTLGRPTPSRSTAGQATAEYALVLLGVGALALLVFGWATHTNAVGRLLDAVFSSLLAKVR